MTLLALAAGLITGCSKKPGASGPLPDGATLIKQSSVSTKAVTSAHLELVVTGKIAKLPVKTLTGDLTNTPQTAAKGDTKITMMGSEVEVKFVVFGGTLYAALSGDTWDDYGPASKIYDVAAILNPDTGLANVLANFTEASAQDHQNINGQDTIRVVGKVSAEAVNKIAPQLSAKEPMPAKAWIQPDGDHQLVQIELDQSSDNSITMTLSNWNKPVTVDKPEV